MLWREASLDTVTSRRECADLSRSGWAAARFEVMRFPNPWRREFSQLLIENSFLQHRRASLRPDGRGRPSGLSERSEEHTSELQSHHDLVCRLLLEKKNQTTNTRISMLLRYLPLAMLT